MNIRSSAVAACLLAAVTAGCGTVTASSSGGGATSAASAAQATASAARVTASAAATKQSQAPTAVTASAGARSSCQHLANGTALTLSSNGRTYCIAVGEHFNVFLRGTLASRWLEPVASSNVIVGAPNGAMSLIAGVTGASFAGARPGQALITSVRPPCAGSLGGKNELEPSGPLPKTYPLHVCAPQRRFSVVIDVLP